MSFYRDQGVLVTGHTGFKGSWLSLWLAHLGARVSGLSLPPTVDSLFHQAGVERQVESFFGDLRVPHFPLEVLERTRPRIVFHLAAQAVVTSGYRDPLETYATNVMGTVHLLEAVRRVESVQVVVVVTSDKCYENREWEWPYRETDRLGGRDPYSASKACAELVAASYRDSFFGPGSRVRLATARAGNVIGGGDFGPDRLLPDVVRAVRSGVPVSIRAPGAVRPWQHVFSPLEGYLALAERLAGEKGDDFAEAWNFGPSEELSVTVLEVLEMVRDRWPQVAWTLHPSPLKEARQLQVSSAKARARLGWRNRIDVPRAVDLAVAWYRNWLARPQEAVHHTLSQLEDYLRGDMKDRRTAAAK